MKLTVSDSLLSNLFVILAALFVWSAIIGRLTDMDHWFGKAIWFAGVAIIGFGAVLAFLIWAEGQGLTILQ